MPEVPEELPRLLWISPGIGLGDDLLRRLRAAVAGGLRAFQLREKSSFARSLALFAPKLRAILPRGDGLVLINDRVDVCLATDLDGVQIGHGSIPVASARALVGTERWVGASVHDDRELADAEEGGADFVIVSPVFPVRKRGMPPAPPLGLVGLETLTRRTRLPVFALGGIRPARVREVVDQGVHGIAVSSALAEAEDPKSMATELVEALRR